MDHTHLIYEIMINKINNTYLNNRFIHFIYLNLRFWIKIYMSCFVLIFGVLAYCIFCPKIVVQKLQEKEVHWLFFSMWTEKTRTKISVAFFQNFYAFSKKKVKKRNISEIVRETKFWKRKKSNKFRITFCIQWTRLTPT